MEMETDKQAEFEIRLRKLLEEFDYDMYAANIVVEGGEVIPVIKTRELIKEEVKKDEDNTKERPNTGKKA